MKPQTIATQHGSTYIGDGERALHGLSEVMREVLGENEAGAGAG